MNRGYSIIEYKKTNTSFIATVVAIIDDTHPNIKYAVKNAISLLRQKNPTLILKVKKL